MRNNITGIKLLFNTRENLLIIFILFLFFTYLYYFALTQNISFEIFISHNNSIYVFFQIFLSLLNSILSSLSVLYFLNIFYKIGKFENKSIISIIISTFGSIITTGCYVCGSFLLPYIGLASSLALLPLGGIEIKLATMMILIYTIFSLNQKYLGICKPKRAKYILLKFRNTKETRINIGFLYNNMVPILVYLSAILIVLVPGFFFSSDTTLKNETGNSCIHER